MNHRETSIDGMSQRAYPSTGSQTLLAMMFLACPFMQARTANNKQPRDAKLLGTFPLQENKKKSTKFTLTTDPSWMKMFFSVYPTHKK